MTKVIHWRKPYTRGNGKIEVKGAWIGAATWADEANKQFADIVLDISKLNDKLTKLKKTINHYDQIKDSENPFIALIDKHKEDMNNFIDKFSRV